jgi:hypothetical protein
MTQQYGFRASSNLSEVLDGNVCLDNLGIDRRDLALLVGTSDAGVTESDYQAIIGLSSNLEQQIVALSSGATVSLSGISARVSRFGDTFTGTIFANIINNDRPYTTQSGVIIGPSTVSYFSPSSSGLFSSGGEYKLGPVTAATVQSSGINYTGTLNQWSNQFVRYKNFVQLQEQPSWTTRRVPLFLPPPTAISGCVMWLDAEFSEIDRDGSSGVIQWKGVGGGPVAVQTTAASRPLDGSRNIDLGAFTTAVQANMALGLAENNGTFTFAVRASAAYGLEIRENGAALDYKSTGFTYTGGDTYILGSAPGGTGPMNGDIHSFAFFNRVLSDKELRTVEEYFTWRYDGVYDPDREQKLQLEDFATIDLEDGTPISA